MKTGEVVWMKEPYDECLASHIGPESCAVVCKGHLADEGAAKITGFDALQ
jgi:hypothetical protein